MKKLLIVLAVAGGLGWWYTHRGISESQVQAFYGAQVEAFGKQDATALCAQYAPDYKGVERQTGERGVQVLHPDKDMACKSLELLFGLKKKFDAKQKNGDELGTELNITQDSVEIARDRKSADVHLTVHLNFGGMFVSDSTAVEHLVWRNGKVLSAGSEGDSRVSGFLASGAFADAISSAPGEQH